MSLSAEQPAKIPTPKAILWLSILMILLFFYQLYAQFGLLRYILLTDTAKWDFSMAMYFIRPLVVMLVAAVLFALRKNSGWVLLSGYFTYLGLNTLALLYFAFRHPPDTGNRIDQLLPSPSIDSLIGWAIFIIGCLYFLCKKDVREVYSISLKNVIFAITIGVFLMLSSMFG